MAAIQKHSKNAVIYKLRHLTREHSQQPSNIDIDSSRTKDNYYLSPESHGRNARECKNFLNRRLEEVYVYNRGDVVTAAQWVITAPKELPKEEHPAFFQASYDYLNSIYGEDNCIIAIVHTDEGIKEESSGKIVAGEVHLHYMFTLPVALASLETKVTLS